MAGKLSETFLVVKVFDGTREAAELKSAETFTLVGPLVSTLRVDPRTGDVNLRVEAPYGGFVHIRVERPTEGVEVVKPC